MEARVEHCRRISTTPLAEGTRRSWLIVDAATVVIHRMAGVTRLGIVGRELLLKEQIPTQFYTSRGVVFATRHFLGNRRQNLQGTSSQLRRGGSIHRSRNQQEGRHRHSMSPSHVYGHKRYVIAGIKLCKSRKPPKETDLGSTVFKSADRV